MNLNLGCGNEVLRHYINLDSIQLEGVDVVYDLKEYPWPFEDNSSSFILCKHVLEHLHESIPAVEEIWRILRPGGKVQIHVPYWNSSDAVTDPTHIRYFNEHSFDFFDPDHWRCKDRPYYSKARFKFEKKTYHFRIFGKYYEWKLPRVIIETLAHFFCNMIQVMVFDLKVVK